MSKHSDLEWEITGLKDKLNKLECSHPWDRQEFTWTGNCERIHKYVGCVIGRLMYLGR